VQMADARAPAGVSARRRAPLQAETKCLLQPRDEALVHPSELLRPPLAGRPFFAAALAPTGSPSTSSPPSPSTSGGAISESTKAALAAAKRRGVKLGGPRLAAARKAFIKARSEAADAFAANVHPL